MLYMFNVYIIKAIYEGWRWANGFSVLRE